MYMKNGYFGQYKAECCSED